MTSVLIVDDAPFIREVLRSILEKEGIHVVGEAVDGIMAVKEAVKHQPDVILMDIVMPNKSGIQATIDILKKLPQTRVIACTTVDQEIMVTRAMDAGCVGFINKPFNKEDVLTAIAGGGDNG